MRRILFVYNPNAGKELLRPKLADIIDIFVKADYEVVVYPTQKYKDGYKKILNMEDEYDLLVCGGGDGTLDEVVTGMMRRENQIPIGYIPTGTTNDFARSLHIPRDILRAADTAVNGRVYACDVGKFNEDIFVYIAAFGLFTDVSYQTKQEVKNVLGHLAYLLEGTKRIFNIPAYKIKVEYDGNEIEDEFVFGMITNSRSVGGFRSVIGRKASFDDGEFEVTLIKVPRNPIELQEIVAALLVRQIDSKHMYIFKAAHLKLISAMEIPWTLDGEYGGEHDVVEVTNLHQKLKIMVEESELEKLISQKEK